MSYFDVTGSGFKPGAEVTILVKRPTRSTVFVRRATEEGRLRARLHLPCRSGESVHFAATDGFLRSNIVVVKCE
jgi:hypothetical protein